METSGLRKASEGSAGGRTQDNAEAVVFDTASGISLEEQRDILAGINAMSGGSRLVSDTHEEPAAKKGFLFPLCVNIGAVLLLAVGFPLLFFLHGNDERAIRDSSNNLGITERRMIQEIRRETNMLVDEKENEINSILSKLSAVDTEYKELRVSVENLTEAQQQRAAALMVLQDEYQRTLFGLREEKAAILEDARTREAALRAQAEDRAKELAVRIDETEANLSSAAEELKQLGAERDRVNAAESQMSGFYTLVNTQISEGLADEALDTLEAMKEFLDAPSFQGVRSLERRKQTHFAAIAAMEEALAAFPGGGEAFSAAKIRDENLAALAAQNADLERKVTNLERDIAAYSAEGSEQGRMITEYAAAIEELQVRGAGLEEALDERDSEIQNLRADAERKELEYTALQTESEEFRRQRDDIQRRMEAAIRAFTEEPVTTP